jgi:hypothetical protein
MSAKIQINRAPVPTLWAAVVAERLGYDWDEAVTLGRAVAGMNAATKAISLGIAKPRDKAEKKKPAARVALVIPLLRRHVPAIQTADGVRASDEGKPTAPARIHRYLAGKFGESLDDAREAMTSLARSMPKAVLETRAFELYEAFRPGIPAGVRGWGAKGELDLAKVRALDAPGRAKKR